jgi:biofilm PGA synthesis N-glycosyltransferase PgaC
LRLLVARLESGDSDTVAVASHDLIRNRGLATSAELAAGEASLDVDTVARIEALFRGPLALPGACTLFRADALRAINGWPSGVGSDVVVTWRLLERGWHVMHELLAVAFTDDDVTIGFPIRRRARAARALKVAARESGGTSRLPDRRSRLLARLDRAAPWLDAAFLIGWLQAVALIGTGRPGLAVGYLVLVVPITLAGRTLGRRAQREALDEAGLAVTTPARSWLAPLASLTAVHGPAALWGRASQAESVRPRR